MSLNSALLAGTSGLISNSTAIAAISDNIANVNSPGYKRATTLFNPRVDLQPNSTSYAAGGVQARPRQIVAAQGIIASSSAATDLAISGAGFFVANTNADTASGAYVFTRAGSFTPDANGNLRNSAGYFLQGWPVQADGTIDTNPSDLTSLETVNVGGGGGVAEASSLLRFNANLQATQAVNAGAAGYTTGDMALNAAGGGGLQPDYVSTVQVFDSLGALRTLTFAFMKQDPTAAGSGPNRWFLEVYASPSSDLAGTTNGLLFDADLRFTSEGDLDFTNSVFSTTDPVTGEPIIDIGAWDAGAGPRWATDVGAAAQTITLDLGGANSAGGLSQLEAPNAVISTSVNGSSFGDLGGVEVDESGIVVARFNNGVIKPIYQLPIATFANPDGLAALEGAAYRVTRESGQFTMKEAGIGGAGQVSPRSLESSTVDLATEFTGLITTQRAYSAASKIITTADEMLEELIRIKR